VADIISTDGTFSQRHRELLALLVEMMIPAGDEFLGAADPEIFARALERLSGNQAPVVAGLTAMEDLAQAKHGAALADLDGPDRMGLIDELKTTQPLFMQILQAHVISSYYQDDRVLGALGLPTRSPHPGGYDIGATDWSLLDPVRKREPFYRQD